MPQANNNITGQQWDECDRCKRLFPMNRLSKQKGMLLCRDDFDRLEIERRPVVIMRTLAQGADQEGRDMRVFDRGVWQSRDQEVY